MQFGVSETVAHWGKYRPDAPSVYHNGQVTTFRELNGLINIICGQIVKSNLDSERVAVAVKSKFELLITIISVLRSGKSAVVLNIGLPNETIRINIRDANVSCLIHDSAHEKIKELLPALEEGQTINISQIFKHSLSNETTSAFHNREPGDEWGVLFSSGTTGPPKGIIRDHNSIVTELLGWCLELGLSRQTTFYIGRPIYYTGGLVLALSTLLVAGQLVLNDLTNDNDYLEVWNDYQSFCKSYQLSWVFLIPDQIRAFIRIAEKMGESLVGAEMILTMGGPISGVEKLTASHILSSGIVESWGNSESLGTITEPEDLVTRPNSIGRPFIADELYIIDDDCKSVGPFQYGRIAGNEEAGFAEYCNRPEATSRAKQSNLIISEDIGYTDEDGYFYVCGREQDCVVVNGETLFLSGIEARLREHKSIQECSVVANVLNEVSVELVVAVVLTPGSAIGGPELLFQANNILDHNETLSRLLFIESMPRLPSGKVDKIQLANLVKEA